MIGQDRFVVCWYLVVSIVSDSLFQIVLAVAQMMWTKRVIDAIQEGGGSLEKLRAEQQEDMSALVDLVRSKFCLPRSFLFCSNVIQRT